MMDCRKADMRDLLPELAAGTSSGAVRERLVAHVASCQACQRELQLLQRARVVLSHAPATDVERIVAALPAPGARRLLDDGRDQGRGNLWRIAAAVAILAGGAALGVATLRESGGPESSVLVRRDPAVSPPPAVVAADAEEQSGSAASAKNSGAAAEARPIVQPVLAFEGRLSQLSEADLRVLLASMDDMELLPSAEPEAALPGMGLELEGA